jgi:hypothetical protein
MINCIGVVRHLYRHQIEFGLTVLKVASDPICAAELGELSRVTFERVRSAQAFEIRPSRSLM